MSATIKLTAAQRQALETGRCTLTTVIMSLERAGLAKRVAAGRIEATAAGRAAIGVRECVIRRENGDTDALLLCAACLTSISDYATVLRSRRTAGSCDRCGGPS